MSQLVFTPNALVGPRAKNQAKRGFLSGVKFKVLTVVVENKTYYLFADMYRSPGSDFTDRFRNTVTKEKNTLIEVFKKLVESNAGIKTFKSYYKYFEATLKEAAPTLLVEVYGDNHVPKVMDEHSDFEKLLAQTLVKVFPKVDFTFKDEDRANGIFTLTTDISKDTYAGKLPIIDEAEADFKSLLE